jgi:hypothetical protein
VRYQSYGPLGGKYAFMGYKESSYWRLVRDGDGDVCEFISEQDAKLYGVRQFGTTADFKVEALKRKAVA